MPLCCKKLSEDMKCESIDDKSQSFAKYAFSYDEIKDEVYLISPYSLELKESEYNIFQYCPWCGYKYRDVDTRFISGMAYTIAKKEYALSPYKSDCADLAPEELCTGEWWKKRKLDLRESLTWYKGKIYKNKEWIDYYDKNKPFIIEECEDIESDERLIEHV